MGAEQSGRRAVQTLVVGGGAAGLMAAISAAARGERVILLEGEAQLGRKILISGNGRCNITNVDADALCHYHGVEPGFVRCVLKQYSLRDTLDFFAGLGLEFREEKRGRLFPLSNQARAVVDLLVDRLQWLGGEMVTGAKICAIEKKKLFCLRAGDGRTWQAACVVLASGGLSAPRLGADASGMALAEALGHTRTPLYPGLVSLVSRDRCVARMQGVKVWAEVRAPVEGGRFVVDVDDLLFARYGVSGFSILNLSAQLVPLLARGPRELRVNFFPGKSAEQLSAMLKERWERNPHQSLALSLAGLLHRKVVRALLERFELEAEQQVSRLGKAQRWRLAQGLTSWSLEVRQARSFDYAEVTIGGISTREIEAATLESRLVPGLYFAGEMVDVHGDLGGFNFQWAWSSGHVAGQRGGA